MHGPFPGMDPYLESPLFWRGVHLQLINNIVADLQPKLTPKYVARIDERITLLSLPETYHPDVTVREYGTASPGGVIAPGRPAGLIAEPEEIDVPEWIAPHRSVTILNARDRRVMTVIEVLSPWNKNSEGRRQYQHKQEHILLSEANLVEIDLLREGAHTVAVPARRLKPSDYCVCIHRAGLARFSVHRFNVRDPLPIFAVPIYWDEPDVILDLPAVFDRCYEEGGFARDVEYDREPEPSLNTEDAAWARERIEQWRGGQDHQSSSG